jgi:hypothetical protein
VAQVELFDSRTKEWSFTKLLHPRMWLTAAGIMDTVMFAGGITHRERGADLLPPAPLPHQSIVALAGQHMARYSPLSPSSRNMGRFQARSRNDGTTQATSIS